MLVRVALEAFRPPPERMPYEWADAHRTQPAGRAEPGPWRSSRTPYTKAFQAAAVEPRTRRAFMVMQAQGGKSASFLSIAGHRLQDDPAPIMIIVPTRDMATRVVEPKVDDLIRTTPSLAEVTRWGQKYTTTIKWVNGVPLRLAWGGKSTAQTKADDACIVLVDELDEFEQDIGGQGDIVHLADARHNSYPDGRTLGTSTPSEGAVETYVDAQTGLEHFAVSKPEHVPSLAWRWWQACSRHQWAIPCVACSEYFIPHADLLWAPWEASLDEIEEQARLVCRRCGDMLATRHRAQMNSRGVMVAPGQAVKPYEPGDELAVIIDRDGRERPTPFGLYVMEGEGRVDVSFHVSGLCSWAVKQGFGQLARHKAEAERSGDPHQVKAVVNTQFGECYSVAGEVPEWQAVAARKAAYASGEVPDGVGVLFGTVDVQGDRFEWVVRGWGLRQESWLIDTGVIYGDTSKDAVWDDLEEWAGQTWGGLGLFRIAIDSGFRRDEVYRWCCRDKARYLPTKGELTIAGGREYRASVADVDKNGKNQRRRRTVKLWTVDTDRMKTWIHARTALEAGREGQWWLPADISEDYCRQIVSEQRLFERGRVQWKVIGDNHRLDCEVLQCFLARKERLAIARATKRRSRPQAAPAESRESTTAPSPAAVASDGAIAKPSARGRRFGRRRGYSVTNWRN